MADLFDLGGRYAVVTGACGAIGRAVAAELVRRGVTVALVDADPAVESLPARLPDGPGAARGHTVDVSDPAAVRGLFNGLDAAGARADLLVNNAGINIRAYPEDIDLDTWHHIMAVNLTGYYCMARELAVRAIAAGVPAAIVNVSSTAGSLALGRGNTAYSVSKAGVNQLTRELAVEWAPFGIRVNAIQPAQVDTPAWRAVAQDSGSAGAALYQRAVSGIPAGRFVAPEELVGPILFLASPAAAMVTGAILPVDGGNLAFNASGSLRAREASS